MACEFVVACEGFPNVALAAYFACFLCAVVDDVWLAVTAGLSDRFVGVAVLLGVPRLSSAVGLVVLADSFAVFVSPFGGSRPTLFDVLVS